MFVIFIDIAAVSAGTGCAPAVLIFMGKQINQIGAYDGGKTNSRPTCEVMGVGYSEQVGTYEVK